MGITPGVVIDTTPLTTATLTMVEAPISASSLFGTKKIEIVATLVNVGVIDLVGRKGVSVQNNGLNAVYVSNAITVSKINGIYVAPGATSYFNLDPLIDVPMYAISIGIPTICSIVEV